MLSCHQIISLGIILEMEDDSCVIISFRYIFFRYNEDMMQRTYLPSFISETTEYVCAIFGFTLTAF
jgi:hypothetical protein